MLGANRTACNNHSKEEALFSMLATIPYYSNRTSLRMFVHMMEVLCSYQEVQALKSEAVNLQDVKA